MRHHSANRAWAAGILLASFLAGSQGAMGADGGVSSADDVDAAWKRRALLATKKLSKPGLDVCDTAVERAFGQLKVTRSKNERTYRLGIEIHGQTMEAAYVYHGNRLGEFVISALPARWLVVQKANSKTVSVLVADANCALDLCTNNPFSEGPCTEKRARAR